MYTIKARNANQALPEALRQLQNYGITRESRNGTVLMFDAPCAIVVRKPLERVVFWAERDANPFFHLLEAMWMLAGRNDVAYPASIVSTMARFSDDGNTFNGAYGHRWRRWFGRDQLMCIAHALKNNPDDRRQVLSMWDGRHDPDMAEKGSKDVPCNTHVYFSRNRSGDLDMTVCNRSNDLIWGALGANTVHFSVMQEFVAALIGCKVGSYTQFSNNMHLYVDLHKELIDSLVDKTQMQYLDRSPSGWPKYALEDPYENQSVKMMPLINGDPMVFLRDLEMILESSRVIGIQDKFLRRVAVPVQNAINMYKGIDPPDRYRLARLCLNDIEPNNDWRVACEQWIDRREENWRNKNAK
jgi:thymidylate synthase